ncbi:hypothetical protein [Burkholderia glumae]|uniref:hypothetical protein n=1 Tax=Burkholderia glumae TaxID=337 RepID=UPI0020B34A22
MQQAWAHDLPAAQAHAVMSAAVQPSVERLRFADLVAARFGANAQIAHCLSAPHDRRDIGADPIVVAVFAAILHQRRP